MIAQGCVCARAPCFRLTSMMLRPCRLFSGERCFDLWRRRVIPHAVSVTCGVIVFYAVIFLTLAHVSQPSTKPILGASSIVLRGASSLYRIRHSFFPRIRYVVDMLRRWQNFDRGMHRS